MEKTLPTLADMPPVPEGVEFVLQKIDKVSIPHPFCITPAHITFASDHRGGMLDAHAIRDSGVKCGIRGCELSVDAHKTSVALFIGIPVEKQKDLNSVQDLNAYLMAVKNADVGIDGFAFPVL